MQEDAVTGMAYMNDTHFGLLSVWLLNRGIICNRDILAYTRQVMYFILTSETLDVIATFTTVNVGFVCQYCQRCHTTPQN